MEMIIVVLLLCDYFNELNLIYAKYLELFMLLINRIRDWELKDTRFPASFATFAAFLLFNTDLKDPNSSWSSS